MFGGQEAGLICLIQLRSLPALRVVSFGRVVKPRHLREYDCINYRSRTNGSVYRWELLDKGRRIEVAVEGRLCLDDVDFMVDAAVSGLGLAFVPENRVRKLVADKQLVHVLEPHCPTLPGFFLYYPSRAHLPLKLKALIDYLKKGRRGTAR